MYVFGNDYGGLYNNLLATQQQDASNYFRMADLNRGTQNDAVNQALAQQRLQQEAQQWQWTTGRQAMADALAQHQEDRLTKAQTAQEREADQTYGLAREKFEQDKDAPTASEERDTALRFRNASDLADIGSLQPSDLKDLPGAHKTLLMARNDRAQKLQAQQQAKLQEAADTLNRIAKLDQMTKQSKADEPYWGTIRPLGWLPLRQGPDGIEGGYSKEQRMQQDALNWKNQADVLRAATIPPEVKAQLRVNEDGEWEPSPNSGYPWGSLARGATAGGAATVSASSGAARPLTPDVAQRFLDAAALRAPDLPTARAMAKEMARQAGFSF